MELSSPPKQRQEPLIKSSTRRPPSSLETEHASPDDDDNDADKAGTTNNDTYKEKSFCQTYVQDCIWPGLGLFGESYLLFSLGTLQPLWTILFPDCFATFTTCRPGAVHALSYGAVVGVILGMIGVGRTAQSMGRRWGSLGTAGCMTVGAAGMTGTAFLLTDSGSEGAMIRGLTASLFIFGMGVGGEYPLAASSASEKAMGTTSRGGDDHTTTDDDNHISVHKDTSDPAQQPQKHRGRQIQLVFSMQGMGIFCNSIVMTSLLLIYGQTNNNGNNDGYQQTSLLQIWQWTYVFGFIVLLYVFISRCLYLEESVVWKQDKERRDNQQRLGHAAATTTTANQQQQDTSSVTAPGMTATRLDDTAPGATVAAPTPYDLASPQSDVSSLSAPSLAAMEFQEHSLGGAFLSLKEEPSGADVAEDAQLPVWMLLLKHFGVRLLGVSLCWFLWDVAFYGNKLFQSSFLLALTGQGDDPDEPISLVAFSMAATLNAGVALLGYFGAALLVDHPSIGRRQLQQWGFLLTGILFVACGIFYHSLSSATLVTMYLGSSFFGQLGPNATTFVLPAEVFPTQVRTSCHGIAAAAGKVGALTAAIFFPLMESELDLFMLSGYASLAASVVTFWTIPETTGLDLFELDRKWRMILTGRRGDYQGPANHPRFLSYYERHKWSERHNRQHESELHYNHAMDDF